MESPLTRRQFGVLAAGTTLVSPHAVAADTHVDWLAEVQRPPERLPEDAPQLNPLDEGISDRATWRRRAAAIHDWWLDFLGPLARGPRGETPFEVIERELVDGVRRERIRYLCEGQEVEAYVLAPREAAARSCAGVAVFHSTVAHSLRQPAGVEGRPEKAFGWQLARRGMVTICPRNYLWPRNVGIAAPAQAEAFLQRQPQSKGMARMLLDAQVAVDLLVRHPLVDPGRIGAVGHSLGAKEVLYLAAFDERVRATVSSEGGIGTRFSNWNAPWYLGPEIDKPSFDREHHELLALCAPRPFLLVGGDSADGARSWPFIDAALPIYHLHGRPAALGLFNHGQGHSVPPAAERRIYDWLTTYTKEEA